MTTPIAQGQVDVNARQQQQQQQQQQQRCANCAHTKCTFHGEDRLPMYRGLSHQRGAHCWIYPESELGAKTHAA